MRFGVNYTPSEGWFHSWLNPQFDSIARDLDAIASLGVDHIRMFPLWPLLQPNRTWINQRGLEDLRHVAEIASERGLHVYSDVLQGHLSSFDFVPSWLVSWHETNMFTDEQAINAQAALVEAVYDALCDVSGFRGITIGNECNQFTEESHPRRMKADAHEAEQWLSSLITPLAERAKTNGHLLVHSENDAIWYSPTHAFEPRHASLGSDVSVVHSWVFNGTAQRYGALSYESVAHGAYLVELAKACAPDLNQQVWLQEIGAPCNVMSEEQTVDFCRQSIELAMKTCKLYGITWWCSHDVSHMLSDFPPFEHQLGLFDEQGKLKPIGAVFKEMVQHYGKFDACMQDTMFSCDADFASTAVLIVPFDEHGNPTLRSACAPGGSVFAKWMELSQQYDHVLIVPSNHEHDSEWFDESRMVVVEHVDMEAGIEYSAVSDSSLSS